MNDFFLNLHVFYKYNFHQNYGWMFDFIIKILMILIFFHDFNKLELDETQSNSIWYIICWMIYVTFIINVFDGYGFKCHYFQYVLIIILLLC